MNITKSAEKFALQKLNAIYPTRLQKKCWKKNKMPQQSQMLPKIWNELENYAMQL